VELSTEDYVAIQQLYARYAWGIDTGDLDAYVSTWTEDGEYIGFKGGVPHPKGHDELRALAAASFANTAESGYHLTSNLVIEASEGGARGRCYLLRVIAHDDGSGTIRNALHYEDELVKRDGKWLFRRRHTRASAD
jgi:uncharacterized protein (TIGR02246 family)